MVNMISGPMVSGGQMMTAVGGAGPQGMYRPQVMGAGGPPQECILNKEFNIVNHCC